MNSSKKNRQIDTLSRVRKRNSIGKPASNVSRKASQKHASLLINNKGLARTLQETRCELSLYKNFYEESLECISKAKHAKSRLTQLFDQMKNCMKTFEENLSLMDIDESKLSIIKPPVLFSKGFHMEMNPVPEAASELPADQEMNAEEESKGSDPMCIKSDNPVHMSRSPHKKADDLVENEHIPHSENVNDNESVRTEVPNEIADSGDSQDYPPPATLPSQTGKITRIPRILGVHREKQVSSNKHKSPQKTSDEIVTNLLRRKTFVVRNNIITVTKRVNKTGENETEPMNCNKTCENETASPELLVSITDKRQTFVIKQKEEDTKKRLEETESAATLINTVGDKEHIIKNRVNVDESEDLQEDALQNKKMKTFVKKLPLHQNDLEFQVSDEPVAKTRINVEQSNDVQKDILQNKKRKTFVKKPPLHQNDLESQVLEEPVAKPSINVDESNDVQKDILQNKKRKTFVKKPPLHQNDLESQVLEEPVIKTRVNVGESKGEEDNLQNKIRKTFVKKMQLLQNDDLESQVLEEPAIKSTVNVVEIRDVQDDVLKNRKRKTLVKKTPLLQNDDLDCQASNPDRECPTVNSEIENHSDETENLKLSHILHRKHSETNHTSIKNKLVSAENSANTQSVTELATLNSNETSGTTSKEMLCGSHSSDNSEKMPQNRKFDTDQTTTEVAIMLTDVMAKKSTDDSPTDENIDKMHEISLKKNHKSIFDSSESGSGSMLVQQTVDFRELEIPPLLQTTPIRRQITTSKKNKFKFDSKRRKTVVKKKSQVATINSEKGKNGSQEGAEDQESGDDVINNNGNDACVKSDMYGTHVISGEVFSTDDISNIPAVREKTTKRPRKKDKGVPTKTAAEKKAEKVQKIKNQKNSFGDVELDVLSSQVKKFKRSKKKKSGPVCFDEDKITKFVAERKPTTKVKKVKKATNELESESPDSHMVQTGTNNSASTWLVQADIEHVPPSFDVPDTQEINGENKRPDRQNMHMAVVLNDIEPPETSSKLVSDDEQMNKENKKLDLPHMQVSIVLDDILKSKDIEALNISDNLLNMSFKAPLSKNISNIEINTDESIEKGRFEPACDADDYAVQTDAVLGNSNPDVLADPVLDDSNPKKLDDVDVLEIDTENPRGKKKRACVKRAPVVDEDDHIELIDLDLENPRGRRRKNVNYKEKPLNVKMRRC